MRLNRPLFCCSRCEQMNAKLVENSNVIENLRSRERELLMSSKHRDEQCAALQYVCLNVIMLLPVSH
jgi:hypothetical protein